MASLRSNPFWIDMLIANILRGPLDHMMFWLQKESGRVGDNRLLHTKVVEFVVEKAVQIGLEFDELLAPGSFESKWRL